MLQLFVFVVGMDYECLMADPKEVSFVNFEFVEFVVDMDFGCLAVEDFDSNYSCAVVMQVVDKQKQMFAELPEVN